MKDTRKKLLQIVPPAIPTWIVSRDGDGRVRVPLHLWGIFEDEHGNRTVEGIDVITAPLISAETDGDFIGYEEMSNVSDDQDSTNDIWEAIKELERKISIIRAQLEMQLPPFQTG